MKLMLSSRVCWRLFALVSFAVLIAAQPTVLAQTQSVSAKAAGAAQIVPSTIVTAARAQAQTGKQLLQFRAAQVTQGQVQKLEAQVGQVHRVPASALAATGPRPSAAELESLLLRKIALREQMAAAVDNNPPSPPGIPPEAGSPTEVKGVPPAPQFPGPPGDFMIARNNLNPQANDPLTASTLAEPAAANNSDLVFAAGNFRHAEFSQDGGVTWTDDSPTPIGPPGAEIAAGDSDIVIDGATRVGFYSLLYLNSTVTNGIVRIHVRRNLNAPVDCAYDIVPTPGTNVFPDYPHLGVTKRFLWLSTNEIVGSSQRARMYRFPIDQMASCADTVDGSFVEWAASLEGQRVWVPAGGTNNSETMYWGHNMNTTTFRLFSWDESSASASNVTRTVSPSIFTQPDCRGGVNNTNFINATAVSIVGFSLRGTLMALREADGYHNGIGFFWQAGANPAAGQPQGFVRAAIFRDAVGGFALVGQPDIFSPDICFGFPIVTANSRGDIGITLAAGGQAGGGGTAAQGFVGISDEFTGGNGSFGSVFIAAAGSHNRADGRFGDYFTIHPYEPCEKWFSATSYALNGGTAVSNVNSRYVEFGRNESFRCYNSHTGQLPNP